MGKLREGLTLNDLGRSPDEPIPGTILQGRYHGDGTDYDLSGGLPIATYHFGGRDARVIRRRENNHPRGKYEYWVVEETQVLQVLDHEPTRSEVGEWLTPGKGHRTVVL